MLYYSSKRVTRGSCNASKNVKVTTMKYRMFGGVSGGDLMIKIHYQKGFIPGVFTQYPITFSFYCRDLHGRSLTH